MSEKSPFSAEQAEKLFALLDTLVAQKGPGKKWRNEREMAADIGVAQQSLNGLIKRSWTPSVRAAHGIARASGIELRDVVGNMPGVTDQTFDDYPNLDVCVRFHTGEKTWSPWTLAAARAGFFGAQDWPARAWVERLDRLETALAKLKR
jgi:DNA-binding XRE family transcriptional regulator